MVNELSIARKISERFDQKHLRPMSTYQRTEHCDWKPVAIVALACCLPTSPVLGDALMVTRAMTASTIAQIYVEDQEVRVELEIGAADLKAFANLLPNDLYLKLTETAQPLEDRLPLFFEQDWVIEADAQPLDGTINRIVPTKRVVRDEITGQPLPNQPSNAEVVIRVELSYPLEQQPQSLSIRPPQASESGGTSANIGFVVYHNGVAVNDFRYLSRQETLGLDWSDPWYSAFDQKTLRRQYFAPAAAFLYIENFEVRKEIVFRPKDLQAWVDLGLDGKQTITADGRDAIREQAASFLAQHTPILIDGEPREGTLDRIHFINRSLRTTGVVPPDQDIDIDSAILGAIYVYPIESLPTEVTLDWQLFNERILQIPCVATDEAGGMPGILDQSDSRFVWRNYLKNPTTPAFLEVTPPTRPKNLPIPIVSLACFAAALIVWIRGQTERRSVRLALLLIGVGLVTTGWPSARLMVPLTTRVDISSDDASSISYSLLHNIYRAFDHRDEGTVYDVLARSAAGDLLTEVYLETRQSLTLASQGGAKVKVKHVELLDCQSEPTEDDAFLANCRWIVSGSVGHWGHIHQRSNQYHGELVIRPIDGQWKITSMELLSEERL
jgi:hypothetical protein